MVDGGHAFQGPLWAVSQQLLSLQVKQALVLISEALTTHPSTREIVNIEHLKTRKSRQSKECSAVLMMLFTEDEEGEAPWPGVGEERGQG